MSVLNVLIASLQQLVTQLIVFLPKVIVAFLIWVVGIWFLQLAVKIVQKLDIRGTKIDDHLRNWLAAIVLPLGKFFLVLIVLDYLGVGRTVISAVANGFTLAVAIALGMAFGRALEPEAKKAVSALKKHWQK